MLGHLLHLGHAGYELIHGTHAAHHGQDGGERTHGLLSAISGGLSLAGAALTRGAAPIFNFSRLGAAVAGGGAAGVGAAATAAGAVMTSGLVGYGAGTAINEGSAHLLGGQREVQARGVDGGVEHVADTRRLSDRLSDATHTETGDRVARWAARRLPVWLGGDN